MALMASRKDEREALEEKGRLAREKGEFRRAKKRLSKNSGKKLAKYKRKLTLSTLKTTGIGAISAAVIAAIVVAITAAGGEVVMALSSAELLVGSAGIGTFIGAAGGTFSSLSKYDKEAKRLIKIDSDPERAHLEDKEQGIIIDKDRNKKNGRSSGDEPDSFDPSLSVGEREEIERANNNGRTPLDELAKRREMEETLNNAREYREASGDDFSSVQNSNSTFNFDLMNETPGKTKESLDEPQKYHGDKEALKQQMSAMQSLSKARKVEPITPEGVSDENEEQKSYRR